MLRRKLCSVFQKRLAKYSSTVPLPKTENDLSKESFLENKEIEILESPDYFKVCNLFTVKDLFDAKVHYGHKISSVHHNMKPFVFGSRLGHVIFDLDTTAYHLGEALNFAAHVAYRNGIILFVSRNPAMTLLVEKTAAECKEFAVTREWRIGTLTDSQNRFQTYVRLPDLCILLNTLEENGSQHQVVLEAAKLCIPTIGIVDSNCCPNLITYPVPGNDDSFSCFKLYCKLFKEAILRGKNERKKILMENSKITNTTNVEIDLNKETNPNISNGIKIEETHTNVKDNVKSQ